MSLARFKWYSDGTDVSKVARCPWIVRYRALLRRVGAIDRGAPIHEVLFFAFFLLSFMYSAPVTCT